MLRGLLKGLPDLPRGLCRIQYGKVRGSSVVRSDPLTRAARRTQATPPELATFLRALNKIASAFAPAAAPADVGFASATLNGIVFALPGLRPAVQELLAAVALPKMQEGRKDEMWADPGQHAGLDEAATVRTDAGGRKGADGKADDSSRRGGATGGA
jgi:DNA mismatch repair protein MSH3